MGKRLKNAYANIDSAKLYTLDEAIQLIKSNATAKFDETVDIAVQLGVDP